MSAFNVLKDALTSHSCAPKENGSGWVAKCPAHDDARASLSFKAGDDGNAVLNCFANCRTEDVVAALGLSMKDLSGKPKWEEVCSYPYTDENGKPLFEVVRYKNKEFRQRHRDAAGNVVWNMQGVRRVLYRLREVIATAKAGGIVYVVEGEKDADAGNALDTAAEIIFTTNPGGAGKWKPEHRYSEHLRGAHVVIVADRDEPGRKHATQVAKALQGIAASVRTVEAAYGKDLHNHLSSGHSLDQLVPVDLTSIESKDAPTTKSTPANVEVIEPWPTQSAEELLEVAVPDPDWIIPGAWAWNDIHNVIAPGGSSKSLWTFSCGLSLASGLPIVGEFQAKRTARVLIVQEEDPPDISTLRVQRLMAGMGLSREHLGGRLRFTTFQSGWVASNSIHLARLRATIEQFKPDVVFIDSITQTSGIEHQGINTEVRQFFREIVQPIRRDYGCGIALVHHTNKSAYMKVPTMEAAGMATGSPDFINCADSVYMLQAVPKARDRRVVTCLKARRLFKPKPFEFELHDVDAPGPPERRPLRLMFTRHLEQAEADSATRADTKMDKVLELLRDAGRPLDKYELAKKADCHDTTVVRALNTSPNVVQIPRAGQRTLFTWQALQ